MALTLDPILASAQENVVRKPLVEIISSDFTQDIPFDANFGVLFKILKS